MAVSVLFSASGFVTVIKLSTNYKTQKKKKKNFIYYLYWYTSCGIWIRSSYEKRGILRCRYKKKRREYVRWLWLPKTLTSSKKKAVVKNNLADQTFRFRVVQNRLLPILFFLTESYFFTQNLVFIRVKRYYFIQNSGGTM